MKKVKFLHCADIHIDAPFTSLGTDIGKSTERRQDLKETFKKIIEIARDEKVDIILLSGDLYEHNYVRRSSINFLNDRFKEIPEIKVFIIPGNHDPAVSNSFYRNFSWNENVYILSEENPSITLGELGICVSGMGFKSFYEEALMVSNIRPSCADFINILLVHGTIDMDIRKERNSYNAISSKDLAALGMDYIALGHFHNRIENMGGYGIIYNPGSPEPLGFDEAGEHGIYIGQITKSDMNQKQLDINFIKLNRKYYIDLEVNVTGCSTDEQITDRIAKAVEGRMNSDIYTGLLSITLRGYLESSFKINIQQIQAYFRDKVFFMKIKDESVIDYNFDEIRKEPGLRGLFVRKLFDLIDKEDDENRKEMLKKALYYGIEALESGKVEIS